MIVEAESRTESEPGYTFIEIPGISAAAFEILLKHFYTQEAAEVKATKCVDTLSNLLKACEQFQVEHMLKITLIQLVLNLNPNNFGKISIAIHTYTPEESRSYFKRVLRQCFLM